MKGSMPDDPSSPTRMEAGNLQGGGLPIPPTEVHLALEADKEVVVTMVPLGSSPQHAMYGSGFASGCGGCPNLSSQDPIRSHLAQGSCWGGAHQFCFSMDNILRNQESLSRTELDLFGGAAPCTPARK